jgi:hypothetical protein
LLEKADLYRKLLGGIISESVGEKTVTKTYTEQIEALAEVRVALCNLLQNFVTFQVTFDERTVDLFLQEREYLIECPGSRYLIT